MAYRCLDSLLVIRQGKEAASHQEWADFLACLGKQNLATLKVLILTDGGGPTASQRSELKLTMAGRSVRTAVVSDSMKVRFIIAAVALINREHYGFAKHELYDAYRFLELTSDERANAATSLKELALLFAEGAELGLGGVDLALEQKRRDHLSQSRLSGGGRAP